MKTKGREICRKCGAEDHVIKEYKALPRCILCVRKSVHETTRGYVAGSIQCPQYKAQVLIGRASGALSRLKILQVNLNHCRLAQDLLLQAVVELRPDIVAISEPLYNPGHWRVNKTP